MKNGKKGEAKMPRCNPLFICLKKLKDATVERNPRID